MADTAGIGARLRAARERAGLSQGQVAKLLGLQRPSVSEMEAGRRKVTADEASRLAKLYDVSLSWIIEERPSEDNPMIELAARELTRLKQEDFDTVLQLLKTLRASKTERE